MPKRRYPICPQCEKRMTPSANSAKLGFGVYRCTDCDKRMNLELDRLAKFGDSKNTNSSN